MILNADPVQSSSSITSTNQKFSHPDTTNNQLESSPSLGSTLQSSLSQTPTNPTPCGSLIPTNQNSHQPELIIDDSSMSIDLDFLHS